MRLLSIGTSALLFVMVGMEETNATMLGIFGSRERNESIRQGLDWIQSRADHGHDAGELLQSLHDLPISSYDSTNRQRRDYMEALLNPILADAWPNAIAEAIKSGSWSIVHQIGIDHVFGSEASREKLDAYFNFFTEYEKFYKRALPEDLLDFAISVCARLTDIVPHKDAKWKMYDAAGKKYELDRINLINLEVPENEKEKLSALLKYKIKKTQIPRFGHAYAQARDAKSKLIIKCQANLGYFMTDDDVDAYIFQELSRRLNDLREEGSLNLTNLGKLREDVQQVIDKPDRKARLLRDINAEEAKIRQGAVDQTKVGGSF